MSAAFHQLQNAQKVTRKGGLFYCRIALVPNESLFREWRIANNCKSVF